MEERGRANAFSMLGESLRSHQPGPAGVERAKQDALVSLLPQLDNGAATSKDPQALSMCPSGDTFPRADIVVAVRPMGMLPQAEFPLRELPAINHLDWTAAESLFNGDTVDRMFRDMTVMSIMEAAAKGMTPAKEFLRKPTYTRPYNEDEMHPVPDSQAILLTPDQEAKRRGEHAQSLGRFQGLCFTNKSVIQATRGRGEEIKMRLSPFDPETGLTAPFIPIVVIQKETGEKLPGDQVVQQFPIKEEFQKYVHLTPSPEDPNEALLVFDALILPEERVIA